MLRDNNNVIACDAFIIEMCLVVSHLLSEGLIHTGPQSLKSLLTIHMSTMKARDAQMSECLNLFRNVPANMLNTQNITRACQAEHYLYEQDLLSVATFAYRTHYKGGTLHGSWCIYLTWLCMLQQQTNHCN